MTTIKPQHKQELFLSIPVDIGIYGGAAGGGKTWAIEYEALRHCGTPGFNATIFRRTTSDIRKQGGLWDQSLQLYGHYPGTDPSEHHLRWRFPAGSEIKFAGIQYESSLIDWLGAQICLIGFDQLETFSEKMFWFMVSRNRSTCGVSPYIRATCNPPEIDNPDASWLTKLVDWYLDDDGYPDPDKAGAVRYLVKISEKIAWFDTEEEAREFSKLNTEDESSYKSFTFIPSNIYDNEILLKKDPGYLASLNSQSEGDRKRLKSGCWYVRGMSGNMFKNEHFKIVDVPDQCDRLVRYWDRASTEVSSRNKNPDWTAGVLCGKTNGQLVILDIVHFRGSPAENQKIIKSVADRDGYEVEIHLEQEPGSSGKDVIDHYIRIVLSGYSVYADRPSGDKGVRAKPWQALGESGNIILKRGEWNAAFIAEAKQFPFGKKDQVDAVSGCYKILFQQMEPEFTREIY